jgi:hypothetical protein
MELLAPDNFSDLTGQGFTSIEIEALYYAQEPMIHAIIGAAAQLAPCDRKLALGIIHTISTLRAISDADEARQVNSGTDPDLQ